MLLLRHGYSYGNDNRHIIQPSTLDAAHGLHPKGEEQAARSTGVILGRGLLPLAVRLSPLPRTIQTGFIQLGLMGVDAPTELDDNFREMCKGLPGLPGGMEGRLRVDVETPAYKRGFARYGWGFRHGSKTSGGETARETCQRVMRGMNNFANYLERFSPNQLARPGVAEIGFVYTYAQAMRYGLGKILGWPDIFETINKEYWVANCNAFALRRSREDKTWSLAGKITVAEELGEL